MESSHRDHIARYQPTTCPDSVRAAEALCTGGKVSWHQNKVGVGARRQPAATVQLERISNTVAGASQSVFDREADLADQTVDRPTE